MITCRYGCWDASMYNSAYPGGVNTFSMKPKVQAGILFEVNNAQIAKVILFVSVQQEKLCAKAHLTISCCAIVYNQFSIQLYNVDHGYYLQTIRY